MSIDIPAAPPSDSVLAPCRVPRALEPRHAGMRMTPAEYDAVEHADENYRFELWRGVLLVAPPPGIGERGPNDWLAQRLRNYAATEAGKSLDYTASEQDIEIPDGRRRADRAVWCGLGRVPDFRRDVPQIAVEFVSAGTRDRHRDFVEKRAEYLKAGVKEYWIIDRFRRTVTLCTTPEGDDGLRILKAGATLETPLLPGFRLVIDELLAEIDRVS
ncbi:MAG: Uma2 family endonuclease [Planctomycetota bacterium]